MASDKKIVGGILVLFAGIYVLTQANKELLSILAGLAISGIGVYLVLSGID